MNDALQWLIGALLGALGLAVLAFKTRHLSNQWEDVPADPSLPEPPTPPVMSVEPPSLPIQPTPPITPKPTPMDFTTPHAAWHSVRVLCDEAGLTLAQKNIICACIFQESRFSNKAVGKNKNSTDWGIVQCNDRFHIGADKGFPSVEWVLAHPKDMVQWMIRCQKQGQLTMWASYGLEGDGPYKQWLSTTSPMWALAK